MKLKCLLLLTSTIFVFYANAQQYKLWGISVHAGIPVIQGDRDIGMPSGALGVSGKYVFANNFSARLMVLGGQLNSKNLGEFEPFYSSSNLFFEATGQLNLNIVNFKKRSTGKNIAQLYVGAGIGYNMSNITYKPANSGTAEVASLIIPYGIGMKAYINPTIDIGVELGQRLTFSDNIDGYSSQGTSNRSNDFYLVPNAYITFNLGAGKKDRSLEWVEPTEQLYEELIKAKQEAQDQINLLKKENAELSDKMRKDMEKEMADNKRRSDSLIIAVREAFKNDGDGDGVSDVFDKEPNTPVGALVDGSGRSMDTDKDGIPDHQDKCPTQAGRANNNGCPVQPTREQLAVISDGIKNLQFETGKSIIKPSSFAALDKLAEMLNENSTLNFRIDGHTDNVGDPSANMILSQERADAVKNYLISKGVSGSRITATGYGDTKPVVSNETVAGKAKNRRVDMTIE